MLAKLKQKLRGVSQPPVPVETHFIASFDPETGDIVVASRGAQPQALSTHKIQCNFESPPEMEVETVAKKMPAEVQPEAKPPLINSPLSSAFGSVPANNDVVDKTFDVVAAKENISVSPTKAADMSGSKLRSSVSSFDEEILDLDHFDTQDDDESWLVASPALGNNSEDLLAWLRKDVDRLNPSARRTLAHKLEFLIRTQPKSNSVDLPVDQSRKPAGIEVMSNSATFDCLSSSSGFGSTLNDSTEDYNGGPTIVIANADREDNNNTEEEFYDAYDKFVPSASATPLDGSFVTVANVSLPLDQSSSGSVNGSPGNATQQQQSPTNVNSGTFTRPSREKAKSTANSLSPLMNTSIDNNGGKQNTDLSASPPPADPTINNSRNGSSPEVFRSSGLQTTLNRWPQGSKETSPRPELHPDMHDIQMLASMQEEDLRRCLQDLQLNRRRRTSSGAQNSDEFSPNLRVRDVRSNSDAPLDARLSPFEDVRMGLTSTPSRTPTHSLNSPQFQENKVYPSPGRQVFPPVNTSTFSRAKAGFKTPMSNADFGQTMVLNRNAKMNGTVAAARRPTVPTYKPALPAQKVSTGTYTKYKRGGSITDQRVASLQKSMPNLLAPSKSSEFCAVVQTARSADTGSERGSSGDIPSVLSPANSVHEGFEVGSPTQSKANFPGATGSRLRQPTRLSTPVRTGIPLPAGMKTGIPKPSQSPHVKSLNGKSDDWIDGCF